MILYPKVLLLDMSALDFSDQGTQLVAQIGGAYRAPPSIGPLLRTADRAGSTGSIMYVYEMYQDEGEGRPCWWRRFTPREYENERLLRKLQGQGWFETVTLDRDLGPMVAMTKEEAKDLQEAYQPSSQSAQWGKV